MPTDDLLALPLLSADQEAALGRMIEAGVAAAAVLAGYPLRVDANSAELERIAADGESARERFLQSNLRLVAFAMAGVVRGSAPGVQRDDVFQEGVVAMAEALRRFDWRRGRFSTLALRRIRRHVVEYVATLGGSLGVPAHRAVEIRRARAIAARLESEFGRSARAGEVAAELGLDVGRAESLLRHRLAVSIEGMVGDRQERALATHLQEPQDGPRAELDLLPVSQREALVLRFGLADGRPRSYREIGEETGQSESAARRACERGLAALRNAERDPSDDSASATMTRARASSQALREVDRLSRAGLSLVEVAIALKSEPAVVHDLCQSRHRQDLLARFGRLEQAHGFEPGPYTAPYVVVTEETAQRRERFLAAEAALGDSAPATGHSAPHEKVTAPRRRPAAPPSQTPSAGRSISR
jgi:RNA polymerase primary sigma factor/RNA polymerase nonessential primary-like sigma factor